MTKQIKPNTEGITQHAKVMIANISLVSQNNFGSKLYFNCGGGR